MKNIKGRNNWIIALVVIVITTAFVTIRKHEVKSMPPVDYIKYSNDKKNGLEVSKEMDAVEYKIQYRTPEYMVANEQKDPYLKASVYEVEKTKYQDLEYYFLQISSIKTNQDVLTINLDDQKQYISRQKYYSFQFQDDICLVEDNDTVHCALFNYVPNYGIAPHIDFMLAFEKSKKEKNAGKALFDKILIVNDQVMGYGTIKLQIQKEDINNAPQLTTY